MLSILPIFLPMLVLGLAVAGGALFLGYYYSRHVLNATMKKQSMAQLLRVGGSLSSPQFQQTLNALMVAYQDDTAVMEQIRALHSAITNTALPNRSETITTLLTDLMHAHGLPGISTADLQQVFPELAPTS